LALGSEFKINAKLIRGVTVIDDDDTISALTNKGYGDTNNNFFF